MTIKEYHESQPVKAETKFKARWITSMIEANVPQSSRFGETGPESKIIEKYMNRLVFGRFALYSKDDFYQAWDNTVLDCTREQAELGRFPSWTFGILEAGLKKHLKGKPIDSSRLLPEPVPDPAEERRKQEINDLFENPTPEFAIEKAVEMETHLKNGFEWMIYGSHLINVFRCLEEIAGNEFCKEVKKTAAFAENPETAFRKRLIQHIVQTSKTKL